MRRVKLHADVATLLAEVRYFDERLEPAIAGYQQALGLYDEALDKGGSDYRVNDAMLIANWSLGNALVEADRAEEALPYHDAALAIVDLQLARDPDDSNAARRQAILKAGKADALAGLGRTDDALTLMYETNGWFEEQVERDPDTPGVHRSVAVNYQMTADVLAGAGRNDEACDWWQRTLDKWRDIDGRFGIADFDAPEIGKLETLLSECP